MDDQVSVEVLSTKTEVGSADKLTVGAGVVGGAGVLPPPPPPPQETINRMLNVRDSNFLFKLIDFNLCFKLTYIFMFVNTKMVELLVQNWNQLVPFFKRLEYVTEE